MQRQQPKKANKMQSQRAAPRKQSKKVNPKNPKYIVGGPSSLSFRPLPINYEVSQHQPTWLAMEGRVNHPELGGGIRVAGRQLLTNVNKINAAIGCFTSNGATLVSDQTIFVSPDTFNGRLALQARNYDRYLFRKLKLTFVSRVATTAVGSFALGYVGDSKVPATPNFATISSMCPAMTSPYYGQPQSVTIIDDMNTSKTYFTLLDSTSDASTRLTVQGTIVGAADAAEASAFLAGTIWVDYLIDLYQPTIDQAFTLRLSDEEQKMIVEKRRQSLPSLSATDLQNEICSLENRIASLKGGNRNL